MDCTFKTPEGKFNLRVGAVITDGKRVLVSKDGSHSFYWVTGGRVKLGETTEEAILREIREELDVDIQIDNFLVTVEYDYPTFHLVMHCYLCSLGAGRLVLKEHENSAWLGCDNLNTVAWLPADREVVRCLTC